MRARDGLGLVACLVVAGGCGGAEAAAAPEATAGSEQEATARPVDPLALLPSDAAMVVRADVARLRRSPHWPVLDRWLSRAALDDEERARIETALEATDVLVLAHYPPSPEAPDRGVVVMRGRYGPGALEAWVREHWNDAPLERTDAGHTYWVRARVAAAALDDDTWLMGTAEEVRAALGRAQSPRPDAGFPVAALESMAHRIEFGKGGIDAVAASDDPELRRTLVAQMRGAPIDPEILSSVRELGVRIDADGPIRIRAVAETGSEETAGSLVGAVQRLVSQYGGHPIVRLLGFDVLFRATSIQTEGSAGVLRLDLAEADAHELLGQLDRLDELRRAVGGGGGTAGTRGSAAEPKGAPSKQQP